MSMVSSKFGIGAIQGGVAVGLGLLDPVESANVSLISFQEHCVIDLGCLTPL